MSCCWQENSKMIKQTVTHAHNSGTLTYILAHHSHTLQLQYLTDIQHSFLPLKHSLDNTRVWIMERTSSIAIEPHSGCSKWVKFNTVVLMLKASASGVGVGWELKGGGAFSEHQCFLYSSHLMWQEDVFVLHIRYQSMWEVKSSTVVFFPQETILYDFINSL